MIAELPSYDDLPEAPLGGRSAWGLFGAQDNLGLMNLITPDVTAAAAGLVQTGEVISLNAPLDLFDPPLYERARLVLDTRTSLGGLGVGETYNGFNPQASSQWDALGHLAYDLDGFYNGVTLDQVLNSGRNTIDHWARKGIATRGVLLDLERTAQGGAGPYSAGASHAFTVDDLERARKAVGIEFRPGDVIVFRTGFITWYQALTQHERDGLSSFTALKAAGLEHTEEMARYLWNTHAVAVASDNPSVEVWPVDYGDELAPFGFLHRVLIGLFGMGLGELWWLEDLAASCHADGRFEFFLTSAPLNTRGGAGSPANALAIR